ncbi:MAG: GTPase HflX [Acidobacteria bacterium]|nr:GTPase HflX [Acidobacteriota bacterium]MBF82872.1 GTPase HflX [Acidobacteriota bacterium]MEC7767956.1 GTPase HflX [Acidobacteriota bacterium]
MSERAVLIGLVMKGRHSSEAALDELARLACAAGATPVLSMLQERRRPDPAMFFGRGKVEQLAKACSECEADVVIVDAELSPVQRRNLEASLARRVVDRTQLILGIFARRARTREGKLQVELAQLRYLLPMLVGAGDGLSRPGGGIGTLGPGETKLETDRRRIRRRLSTLRRHIDQVRKRRSQLRARRAKLAVPTVALVGYTNAGKTTLFNQLTGGGGAASNAVFVTLDPLVRRLRLRNRRMVLCTDTVGFLERLPHTLVAAFRATLEEVAEADLLLHVCDASSQFRDRNVEAVRQVLSDIGADEVPCVTIWNKSDLIAREERRRLRLRDPEAICLSALDETSAPIVLRLIETWLGRRAIDRGHGESVKSVRLAAGAA